MKISEALVEYGINADRKSNVLLFVGGAMSVGGLTWGTISLVLGAIPQSVVPLGYVVLSLLNYLIYKIWRNIRFAEFFQLAISILLPFLFQWMLGGFQHSGAIMLWAIISLSAAAIVTKGAYSIFWLASYFGLLILSYFVNDALVGLAPEYPRWVETLFFVINIFAISFVVYALIRNFKFALTAQKMEVLESNEELQATTEELRQNNEELHATQEHLEQKIKEAEAAKESLEQSKQLLDEQNLILIKSKEIVDEKNESLRRNNEILVEQENRLKVQSEKIRDSINYALRIQESVIGKPELMTAIHPNIFILNKPKDIVSGDFFWIYQQKQFLYVAAVDCTGHGVPGGFMSMMGHSALSQAVRRMADVTPARLLSRMDMTMKANFAGGTLKNQGMDVAIIRMNLDSEELLFAGARRPLFGIKASGEVIELKSTSKSIGEARQKQNQQKYEDHQVSFQKGDTIYLTSDGYPDQFGGKKGTKLYKKGFIDVLKTIHKLPPQTQQINLSNFFESWRGSEKQIDDVLVIGIQRPE